MSDYYSDEECEEDYADSSEGEAFAPQYAEGFVFVNVYEVDRIYGGPEEGGWWYDAGTAVVSRQVSEADSERVRAELEAKYPKGTGRNSCNSVIYQGGDYRVWVENHPAQDYPKVTPHYE